MQIYTYAISPFDDWHRQAWAGALVLVGFVLACSLRTLDEAEIVDFTRAMIARGRSLDFGKGPIADKHCIGGIPGNRTSMLVVPIVTAHGMWCPKTSSRAIPSPSPCPSSRSGRNTGRR